MKIIEDVKTFKQVFERLGLVEDTLYEVEVKHHANNPKHRAFLFVGFQNGNNCNVYTNGYETPIDVMKLYSLRIIRKVASIKS